jgi:ABC-type branched-subunit amino acid transport system ATPase component
MRYGGTIAALAGVAVLVAGGCTSDPDEAADAPAGDGGGGGGGTTTGLTDDTLRIGFIGADFGALAQAGLAPDLGDQPKIVQSVVDEINENGGIGGRQVEVRVKLVDGIAGPEAGQAACLEMTQDFGAFAVIVAPAVGRDTARCAAVTNQPHRRAGLGLGRTFQDAALFPDLTVRETVQTAVETRARAHLAPVALGLPGARRAERAKRAHADEVLDFLGLGPYGERFVSELSTGMRRIVELACLIATDARVLCLDEPTAGIAQREAEAFAPLLLRVREELGASMLVIEHDMPLVMSISDRIACLDAGALIAVGPPEAVRNDPRVVASYLGTDERAIARSGAVADPVMIQEGR